MEETVCLNQGVTYTLDSTDFNMIEKRFILVNVKICIIFIYILDLT